jgi:hypothetical protein
LFGTIAELRRPRGLCRVTIVDVLQRVGQHPASRVQELTPRLWKQHFAANPLRSPLRGVGDRSEVKITGAEQSNQADDDQINGDDVVQEPRHDEDQNAGDQ